MPVGQSVSLHDQPHGLGVGAEVNGGGQCGTGSVPDLRNLLEWSRRMERRHGRAIITARGEGEERRERREEGRAENPGVPGLLRESLLATILPGIPGRTLGPELLQWSMNRRNTESGSCAPALDGENLIRSPLYPPGR